MRIALDYIPALLRPAGIGRFAHGLARGLCRIDPEMVVLLESLFYRGFPGGPDRLAFPRFPNAVPVARKIPARAVRRFARLFPRAGLRLLGNPDLFHCTDFTEPPSRSLPCLLTVHDVAFEIEPAWYPAGLPGRIRERVRRLVDAGAWILTVSEASRRRIREHFEVSEARVHTAPLGVDHDRFRPGPDPADASVRERLGLGELPYLLHVGTLQPRKNLEGLLAGFRAARARGLQHRLAVAGRPGWLCESVLDAIVRLEREGAARYLGAVSDADLPALYRGATALCALSHDEGFGLPVLEAMASGTAVLVSRAPAFQEVAADASHSVDERDPEGIAEALLRIGTDGDLRARLGRAARDRAEAFTWDRCAREVREVYVRILAAEGGAR